MYDSAFRNIIFRNIPQQLAPGRNGRESPLARLQIFVIQSVSFRFADTHVSVLKVDPFFNTQCLISVRRTQAPVALTTQSPYIVLRVGTTSMYDFQCLCLPSCEEYSRTHSSAFSPSGRNQICGLVRAGPPKDGMQGFLASAKVVRIPYDTRPPLHSVAS
jgi:hypothetical protein